MRFNPLATALVLTLGAALPAATPVAAQGQFSARAYVNNAAITQFEIDQRIAFMRLLGAGDPTVDEALEALIDDRLYAMAGKIQKITVTDDQVRTGMSEFAARGQMTLEQMIPRLQAAGVSEQTFREFVRAGLIWREVVRARFAPRVNVTEADIDRALQVESIRPDREILLSEIILPMVPEYADQSRQIAQLIRENVRTADEFADAASRFSASQSREAGGALDWMREGNLPPQLRTAIDPLSPGQMTAEIDVPNAVAIFFLRSRRDTPRPSPTATTLDYAEVLIPGGRTPETLAQAARIDVDTDTCDDLYSAARGTPAAIARRSGSPGQLPTDVAFELAKLDANEISTNLTRDGNLMMLMLCSRTVTQAEPPSRDMVRNQLMNQRVGQLSDNYLAELRADAIIRFP